jgi:hypothetical protein
MTASESVQWQPLSALPKVARDVDEQFTNTREQYEQLLRARDLPHPLDDAIVARVMRLATGELEFLPVYREQLARWYQWQPVPGQFIELDRMTHQLDRWRELLQQQLALAQELNVGTIDKVLAKSDPNCRCPPSRVRPDPGLMNGRGTGFIPPSGNARSRQLGRPRRCRPAR